MSNNSRLRSWVKGKHSVGKESKCARKETVDMFITSTKSGIKIMQPIRITNGAATRMRRWNQFS